MIPNFCNTNVRLFDHIEVCFWLLLYLMTIGFYAQAASLYESRRPYELISFLISSPFKYANKITDARLGSYRFRIGEYRVIFDLEGNKIVVLRVRHRRDIYRKL